MATGQTAVLFYALFKMWGVSFNSAAMSTSSSSSSFTAGRNSYVSFVGTGIWLSFMVGWIAIIPFTILGIITLPLTAPIVLWKTIDQCSYTNGNWWTCTFTILPWADLNSVAYVGTAG